MTKECEWTPYQWIASIDSCPNCTRSHFVPKTSTISKREAIGEMIKSLRQHKKYYCDGDHGKYLFDINVNIKWNSSSPYAYKSTWEKHKIYV